MMMTTTPRNLLRVPMMMTTTPRNLLRAPMMMITTHPRVASPVPLILQRVTPPRVPRVTVDV